MTPERLETPRVPISLISSRLDRLLRHDGCLRDHAKPGGALNVVKREPRRPFPAVSASPAGCTSQVSGGPVALRGGGNAMVTERPCRPRIYVPCGPDPREPDGSEARPGRSRELFSPLQLSAGRVTCEVK